MTMPTLMFQAQTSGDGAQYQLPSFFKGATCYVVGPTYWRSTGQLSVIGDARRSFIKMFDFPSSEGYGSTSLFGPIAGSTVNGSTVRLNVVADPADAAKQCWLYRISMTDPDTAGSGNKRSELSCDKIGMAIRNKDGGHSMFFATRYCDISTTTTGEQIISQVHASNTNTGCPPWYAIILGPGTRLQVKLRYDPNPVTSDATNVNWTAFDGTFTPNTWDKYYVEYRQSHDGNDGYCRIWRNRVKIVDYTGPLGYVDNGGYSYLKAGIYHWTENGNVFDASVPVRECWQKGPYQMPIGVVTAAEAFDFLDTI